MNELSAALQTRQKIQKDIVKREYLDFSNEVFNENEEEINEFLKKKACDLVNINSKAALALGKIFTEIFDTLGNNKVGTYEKFIKEMGYNVRTVQRYRGRFNLYNKITNPESKALVAILPVKYIEKIMSEEEQFLPILENGIEKSELIKELEVKKETVIENRVDEIDINFVPLKNMLFEFSIKAEEKENNLSVKEKIKLKKLLEQIGNILNK